MRLVFVHNKALDVISGIYFVTWNFLTCQVTDGERLPLAVKELGSCDLYPQVCSFMEFNMSFPV